MPEKETSAPNLSALNTVPVNESEIAGPDFTSVYEARVQELVETDAIVTRKHEGGQTHSGHVRQLGKICTKMAGKEQAEIAEDIAFAELADLMRAGKSIDEIFETQKQPQKEPAKSGRPDTERVIKLAKDTVQPTEARISSAAEAAPPLDIVRPQSIAAIQPMYQEMIKHSEIQPKAAIPELAIPDAEIEANEKSQENQLPKILHDVERKSAKVMSSPIILKQPPAGPPRDSVEMHIPEAVLSQSDTEVAETDTQAILEFVSDITNAEPESSIGTQPTTSLIESNDRLAVDLEDAPSIERPDTTDPTVEQEQILSSETEAILEFFDMALPAAIAESFQQSVQEHIELLEPEVVAELQAQVEQLVIVAGRLHELMMTGREDGEEPQQIIAYISRAYQQILEAAGIEPTPELIKAFIAYIRSEAYELQELNLPSVNDYEDEGTHEKKLFDERSVFAKAHQASQKLGNQIGGMIGRLAVGETTI